MGDGLYGKRCTGTLTVSASTKIDKLLTSAIVNSLVSYGGTWSNGASSNMSVITANANSLTSMGALSTLFVKTNYVYFRSITDTSRTDAPYDIWITYTKS